MASTAYGLTTELYRMTGDKENFYDTMANLISIETGEEIEIKKVKT